MPIMTKGEKMGNKYCRYCAWMCCGDANYCEVKKKTFSTEYIKRQNNCRYFELNPMDALFENKRGYRPREQKKDDGEQMRIGENDV